MGILVDLILVAIIGLIIFLGYKKGLVKVALGIVSFLLSLIIVFILYKPVTNIVLENTQWDDSIKMSIENKLKGTTIEKGELINKEDEKAKDFPEMIVNQVNGYIEDATREQRDNIAGYVADQLSKLVISVGVIIALFILSNILLLFLRIFSDVITEIPIIKQFNKAGGIIYGIIKAFLVVYTILGIIFLISSFIEGSGITEAINDSVLGKSLYNNNLILKILF